MAEVTATTSRLAARLYNSTIPLVVRGLPMDCWKCGSSQMAVAVIHVADDFGPFGVIAAGHGTPLAYARDLLASVDHPLSKSITLRYSKTAHQRYLSNGCRSCDALFGGYGLGEDIAGMQVNQQLHTLPVLFEDRRPQMEWILLGAERSGLYQD